MTQFAELVFIYFNIILYYIIATLYKDYIYIPGRYAQQIRDRQKKIRIYLSCTHTQHN